MSEVLKVEKGRKQGSRGGRRAGEIRDRLKVESRS